jgi:flagellar biosynthesis/type III secretory pathway protein FliH
VEHGRTAASNLEGEAVELAFALAEKIMHATLEADRGAVLGAIRGALRGLVERERVTVLVNPADLELVRASVDELRSTLGGIEHCEIQAERRVGRGGAVVRHAEGQVDARIETKLERAREVVQASLGDADSP